MSEQAETKTGASKAPPRRGVKPRRSSATRKPVALAVGFGALAAVVLGLWFGGGAVWRYVNPPLPDPFRPVAFPSRAWFFAPIERNAFKRLPVITGTLNDVFVLPSGEIWAVGDDGMIVHSPDGGESWASQRQNIQAAGGTSPPPSAAGVGGGWLRAASAAEAPPAKKRPPPTLKLPAAKSTTAVGKQVDIRQRPSPVTDSAITPPSPKQLAKSAPRTGGDATPGAGTGKKPEKATRLADLQSVYFIDNRRGWAVGRHGTILATSDGGRKWTTQASGTKSRLYSVQFLADGRRGWAVGEAGTVLATSDGGRKWTAQASGTKSSLSSVQFLADGRRGWAVGWDGTVLVTNDGGRNWTAQASGTKTWFSSVQFLADGRRGWVVGGGGTVLATSDGGRKWTAQASGTQSWFNSVQFLADGRRGWAVGGGGTVLATSDGGRSWPAQASGTQSRLSSVQFLADGRRGWAVGWGGTIIATSDGGRTWQAQASGTKFVLSSVQFLADGRRGWAVGWGGTIIATSDGGRTWPAQASGTKFVLSSVQFLADGRRGWAVGDSETIIATSDGGRNWTSQASGTKTWFSSVQFLADGRRGWVVGGGGTILVTSDGGRNWTAQASGTKSLLESVQFLADGRRGWAVGWDGTVLATSDGGRKWAAQASGTKSSLYSVQFLADGRRGWAVGDFGTVLATNDGGEHWNDEVVYRRWPSPAFWGLTAFLGLAFGFVALHRRALHDAPESDPAEMTKPTSDATRGGDGTTPEQAGIAEEGVSDRPLGWTDPDYLGFKPIARGLSRLLRNEHTEPPLTIAVTGRWGTGKSSLMNLLREELQGWGFRPVWFNVWHQQEESHMLAALLEAIRSQLVPPWSSVAGLVFRGHLLIRRGTLYWLIIALFLIVIGLLQLRDETVVMNDASVTAIAKAVWPKFTAVAGDGKTAGSQSSSTCPKADAEPIATPVLLRSLCGLRDRPFKNTDALLSAIEGATPGADGAIFRLSNGQRAVIEKSAQHFGSSILPGLWGTLGKLLGALVAFFTLLQGSKVLGWSPLAALQTLVGSLGVRRFKEQVGFRQQFAAEFKLITRCLPRNTVLTLIFDDLDRCSPENVVKTLETVNFLVTAGDCYVVMGMDRQWVQACVSLKYEQVAEELARQHDGGGATERGHGHSADFALRYLEKLVNIEVRVPAPEDDQTKALLGCTATRRRWRVARRFRVLLRSLSRGDLLRRVASVAGLWRALRRSPGGRLLLNWWGLIGLLAVVLLATGWPQRQWQRLGFTAEPTWTSVVAEPATTTSGVPRPSGEGPKPQPPQNTPSSRTEFTPGAQVGPSFWWLLPAGLFGLLAVVVRLRGVVEKTLEDLPEIRQVERDTPEFAQALEIWHPWVVLLPKNNTPRAVKRFKNRVRYFAMRQRDKYSPRTLLQRFLFLLARGWLRGREDEQPIPEPLLVALAAIHHCHPDWIADDEIFETIVAQNMAALPVSTAGTVPREGGQAAERDADEMERAARGNDAVGEHMERFPELWPPTPEQRTQFLKLTVGIKTN